VTDKRPTIVIVGASLAGAKAAETLRSEGFDGRIVRVGSEQYPPYERPWDVPLEALVTSSNDREGVHP
jgi:3-phenylpropionate/trans-cinnamate dioxygenase ferredoxin reductase component